MRHTILGAALITGLGAVLQADPFPYVDFSRPRTAGEPNATLEATVVFSGEVSRVAVDNRLAQGFRPAAAALGPEFEKRIHGVVNSHFGPRPEGLEDAKVALVVHSNAPEGYQLARNIDRNKVLAVYLDSTLVLSNPRRAAAVAAREYYRVLASGRSLRFGVTEPPWADTAMALYAQLVCGYADEPDSALRAFWARPNASIFPGVPANAGQANGGAALSLAIYLFEQGDSTGDRPAFVSSVTGIGLAAYLETQRTEFLAGWAAATAASGMIQRPDEIASLAKYRFREIDPRPVIPSRPACKNSSVAEPAISVSPGGAAYFAIDAQPDLREPLPLALTATGLRDGEVELFAVASRRDGSVSVSKIAEDGRVHVDDFGAASSSRLTLVFVNYGTSPSAPPAMVAVSASATLPSTQSCPDISGAWDGTERGTLTCTFSGPGESGTDRDGLSGSARLTIVQRGCEIEYDPIRVPGVPASVTRRTGQLEGDQLTVRGVFGIPQPGVRVTENSLEASGTARSTSIALNSKGVVTAMLAVPGGTATVSCVAETTADFTRPPCSAPRATINSAASQRERVLGPDAAATFALPTLGASAASANPASEPPSTLGGISLRYVDGAGTERNLPLLSTSSNRADFLTPPGIAPGPLLIAAYRGQQNLGSGWASYGDPAPALHSATGDGTGTSRGSAVRVRGGVRSTAALADCRNNVCSAVPIELGSDGDEVSLALDATGFRRTTEVTAVIGGESVPAAIIPGATAGLDVVSVGPLPRSLSGRGSVVVSISADGKYANLLRVEFR